MERRGNAIEFDLKNNNEQMILFYVGIAIQGVPADNVVAGSLKHKLETKQEPFIMSRSEIMLAAEAMRKLSDEYAAARQTSFATNLTNSAEIIDPQKLAVSK